MVSGGESTGNVECLRFVISCFLLPLLFLLTGMERKTIRFCQVNAVKCAADTGDAACLVRFSLNFFAFFLHAGQGTAGQGTGTQPVHKQLRAGCWNDAVVQGCRVQAVITISVSSLLSMFPSVGFVPASIPAAALPAATAHCRK